MVIFICVVLLLSHEILIEADTVFYLSGGDLLQIALVLAQVFREDGLSLLELELAIDQ